MISSKKEIIQQDPRLKQTTKVDDLHIFLYTTSTLFALLSKINYNMKQRQSTRVAVLSKSMRVVDEDTRTEFHHLRLLALEVDNYQEQGTAAAKDEEAFTLSDDVITT